MPRPPTSTPMAVNPHQARARHREYLKGDSWRCSDAPVNECGQKAHHWQVEADGAQTCCHCGERREPVKWGGMW